MRNALLASMILSLAVQAGTASNAAADEDSPYYTPPAGSKLLLKRGLTVPAGQASVLIQNGQVVPSFSQVSQYEPYCKLEMQRLSDSAQTVQPGEFVVNKTQRERSYHGRAPTFTPGFVYVAESIDRGHERRSTHLYLQSGQQPDVFRMTCQRWQDASRAKNVTLREIRQTLGDLFSLQVPS